MKKILTIVISVALVAAIAIGGTLAYLTSTANDTVLTNTFVSGPGLSITLDESPIDETTGLAKAGARVASNAYPLIPGEAMDKDPLITVKAGSQPCYVFAYVTNTATVTAATAGAVSKPAVTNIDIATSEWDVAASNSNGTLYVYSSFDAGPNEYTPIIVSKDDENDRPLPKVFTKITINSALTVADLAGTKAGSVTVQAYAHQATTGTTYATALAAAKTQFGIS